MDEWFDEVGGLEQEDIMTSRVGQRLGKYQLGSLVGRGVVGETYGGEDIESHQRVSIVVLEQRFERNAFFEKAHTLAQLQHPNIVQVRDAGVEESWPFYLVFQNAQDTSLRILHPKGSMLPLFTAVSYARQVAAALHYAHRVGLTNLFVRPENMFLGEKHEVVLAGFESHFANWENKEQLLGSREMYAYMAPEFFSGQHTAMCDQYALAVTVYEWLTGSPPISYDGSLSKFVQQLQAPLTPLQQKNPAIPLPVAEVVMKALAKRSKERFADVQAFAEALEQACPATELPLAELLNPANFAKLLGKQFGHYQLTRILGQSSSGAIYLGEHTDLGKHAAIKILRPEFDTDDFRAGIQRIANLSHRHIMRITDFNVHETLPFLVMEYAPHGTMSKLYPAGTVIPLETVVSYVKQIASALYHAHNMGVVHGNLTPADMLLQQNDDILLSGFNPLEIGYSATKQVLTGGVYDAPERVSGKRLPTVDQYALAAIAYEWLSGSLPSHDAPVPLNTRGPHIPEDVSKVVMKALNTASKQRYANIQEFAEALEQAISATSKRGGELVGQRLGDYNLRKLLGKGGFGDVYLGRHQHLNTPVAVKVLQSAKRITEEEMKLFRREAQTLVKLEHANIVKVQDYGVENDVPFLVMDYYSDGSIRKLHPSGTRLPPATVLSYVKQMARALQHAHTKKYIHRDVKPDNILVDKQSTSAGPYPRILLTDFGLSIVVHSSRLLEEQEGQDNKGTLPYMAPEHLVKKAVYASDQYSLAITTYEWLCGARPFVGDSYQLQYQITHVKPPSLQEREPNITPEMETVILKALAKAPEDRFSSVQEYAEALEKAIEMW